jgi:hypothetical protein
MIIRENALYILIEGKPYSPEVSFFKQLSFPDDIVPLEFVEVGGSGSFNIVSELIYNKLQIMIFVNILKLMISPIVHLMILFKKRSLKKYI